MEREAIRQTQIPLYIYIYIYIKERKRNEKLEREGKGKGVKWMIKRKRCIKGRWAGALGVGGYEMNPMEKEKEKGKLWRIIA